MNKFQKLAIDAVLVLALAVALAPFGVPVLVSLSARQLPTIPVVEAFFKGGDPLGAYLGSLAVLFSSFSNLGALLAWVLVSSCMLALALLYNRAKHPPREIDGGILGKQQAITSKAKIASMNCAWNGEGKPAEGVALGTIHGKSLIIPCIHAAICAPSGAGKTRGSVYPTIDALTFAKNNNLLVTDPSLEIFITTNTCLRSRGYNVALLDLENPRQGFRFNLLKLISDLYASGDEPSAEARARETGAVLFPSQGNENDIFVNAAGGVFSATAYVVSTHEDIPDAQRHIWSVVKTILEGTVSGAAVIKDWLRSFGADSPALTMAATFLSSEGKLESSILASLHDGLQPYTSINMRWLLSASEIDIDAISKTQSAVFIHTLGPGSPTNRIAALFFAQHWAETQRLGKRRNLRPCWVIGDEWHSVPRFDLVHAIENARKYSLHYVMYTQSFSGYDQYKTSKEDGKDAILANCDAKALYRAGSDLDARYFETLGGHKTVNTRNTGQSKGGTGSTSSNEGFSEHEVPVWPVGDILERNPFKDGVLVVRSASSGNPAGKFEIPMCEVSKTFTAKHFGTLGSKEFERAVISKSLDQIEAEASKKSIEVTAWTPDFNASKTDEMRIEEVAEDEFAAWDE